MKHIVLGYDGSAFSMQALDWALDEAELRGLSLTVAHAWQWPYGEAPEEARSHLRKAAEHVLWHGADCARHTSSGLTVETDLHEGPAAERLLELSHEAALVVVGSRGLSALPRAVVGSVAGYVATHAHCPVIVVRGPGPLPAASQPGPVVVADRDPDGVVLDFAFEEAALRRLPLAAPAELSADLSADLSGRAARHPGVPVQQAADFGTATLVVVGRRRAAPAGVAASLLQHAPCPVAVVGG
ncbi:universal stress protein [Nonomuraea bangladeshensis]|uniref:universal stress protein n=1 Tax=Nonomuraea bangladeshensis TaxID=404385 RepID=UPI003C2C94D5